MHFPLLFVVVVEPPQISVKMKIERLSIDVTVQLHRWKLHQNKMTFIRFTTITFV